MKNPIDITRGYQFGRMVFNHITAVVTVFIIQMIACWYFFDKAIAKYIVSVIFILVYALMIYNGAHRLASMDMKSYTPLKPESKWGVFWGVLIAATILAAAAVYSLNRQWFGNADGQSLNNWGSVLVNIATMIWMAPYMGFLFDSGSNVWIIAAVGGIVSIAASALGYYAGMTRFDLLAKLNSMTVEKKNNDDAD